jgi:hypothetical protein
MDSSNYKLALIILNWNNVKDTIECLQSIKVHLDGNIFKIYLVDNGSTQNIDELKEIGNKLPLVLIRLNNNTGFAAGNNVGIKMAVMEGFDYIMLVNNDTVFVDNSLYSLIKIMQSNNNLAIGGLVNYYYSNPEKVWNAGLMNNLFIGKNHTIKNFTAKESRIIYVDYVPGSALIVKRSVFEKVGLLDERYFAYYEENDFCLRAKKYGFRTGFLTSSRILHKVGNSSVNYIKIYLRTRNMLLFYFKYSEKIFLPIIILVNTFRILYEIALNTDKIKNIKAFILGVNDFIKGNLYSGSLDILIKD